MYYLRGDFYIERVTTSRGPFVFLEIIEDYTEESCIACKLYFKNKKPKQSIINRNWLSLYMLKVADKDAQLLKLLYS